MHPIASKHIIRFALTVTLTICFSAISSASHFQYVATIYQMRKGQTDSLPADLIAPTGAINLPLCTPVSGSLGIELVLDPGDPPTLGWICSSAHMTSTINGARVWTYTGSQTIIPPGQTLTLPSFPSTLDILQLTMDEAVVVGPPNQPATSGGAMPAASGGGGSGVLSSSIYLTLGTPAAPMTQPFPSVLQFADSAAYGESSQTAVANDVTKATWLTTYYNGGTSTFCTNLTDTSETFNINEFLASFSGQCTDLADFVCCCCNAVDGLPLSCLRTCSTAKMNVQADNFHTESFYPANRQTPTAYTFVFHQRDYYQGLDWDSVVELIYNQQIVTGLDDTFSYKPDVLSYFVQPNGLWDDGSSLVMPFISTGN